MLLALPAGLARAEEPAGEEPAADAAEYAEAGEQSKGDQDSVPEQKSEPESAPAATTAAERTVYVIPVQGQINSPTLYILRRGLRQATERGINTIVIDMDTPGGALNATLRIMEVLRKFDGEVLTFVNSEAISAGAFIAIATDRIYFTPDGIIGAAEAVAAGGQEIPEGVKRKIQSYINAKVRSITEEHRYRGDVMRAMSDPNFVLEIDGEVLKEAGELLTLTASEAVRTFGDPPHPLLGSGIFATVEDLLDATYGPGQYRIEQFEVTWSEQLAHFLNTIAPVLLGLGMLLMFIEFKTPGFGIFGIAGLAFLATVFISSHIAGLAGYEALIIFTIGVLLVVVELFLFPGLIFPAVIGIAMMLGSLVWAMADVWPGDGFAWDPSAFTRPVVDLFLGMIIAGSGLAIFGKMLPKTSLWSHLVLQASVGNKPVDSQDAVGVSAPAKPQPDTGAEGLAVTALFPNGQVEIDGVRYEARAKLGQIERGRTVRVVRREAFGIVVEEAKTWE